MQRSVASDGVRRNRALPAVLLVAWALVAPAAAWAAPGDLDPSFGDHGVVLGVPGTSLSNAQAMVRDGQGRLIVAGQAFSQSPGGRPLVARYLPDGSLDPTFNAAGPTPGVHVLFESQDTSTLAAFDVALASDGDIVVLYSAGSQQGGGIGIARLNADGTLDDAFGGGDGAVTVAPGGNGIAPQGLAIDSQGRIVVAATRDATTLFSQALVVRLTAQGDLDTTFNAAETPGYDQPALGFSRFDAVAISAGDAPVLAGTCQNANALVMRYTSAGVPDPGFGVAGAACERHGGLEARATSVVVDALGRIYAGGRVQDDSDGDGFADTGRMLVTRRTPTGALDLTWADGGVARVAFPSAPAGTSASVSARAMALTGDGGVAATGTVERSGVTAMALARLNPAGAPDLAVETPLAGTGGTFGDGVAVLPDGRMVVAGQAIVDRGGQPSRDLLVTRHLAGDGPPPTPTPTPTATPTPGGGGPAPGGGAGGSRPSSPFTAAFTTRAARTAAGLAVLDARGTVGASRLLWDVDGDGGDDVACGGDEPVLGVRLLRPGTYTARLTAIGSGGRSVAQRTVSVAGRTLGRRILATTPQTAFCARGDSFVLSGRACAQRVQFGIVEVRGCLERVTDRADVPARERPVVDEWYARQGISKITQALCDKGDPSCPDRLARERALDLLVSRQNVTINGIDFFPRRGGAIVVFPQLQRVVSSDAEMAIGSVTLRRPGAVDLDLRSRQLSLGKGSAVHGRVPLFSFDAGKALPSIGGFGVAGQLDLSLVRDGVRRFSEAAVGLRLPDEFNLFGGPAPQGRTVLQADNDSHGFVLDHLDVGVPEANFGAIRLTDVRFVYSRGGEPSQNCPRQWWKATANVFLGDTGRDAGFRLAPEPQLNGVAFCAGQLHSAGGAVVFGTQLPPPQPFPGVTINEISLAIQVDPTLLRGGMKMRAGDLSEVDGALFMAFPSPSAPYTLTTGDAGPQFAKLAGARFIGPTIAIGGTFSYRFPQPLGTVPFGNAYVLFSAPDYVAMGGGVRMPLPGLLLRVGVDGELALSRGVFSTHGFGEACIAGGVGCLGAEAWVTSTGAVACGSIAGELHPGAGYRWGDTWPTIWWGDGCKPSRYWVTVRASAAQARSVTFAVARGERVKNVRLGGAPEVEVRGPDGETVSTAAGDVATGSTIGIIRQAEGGVTWVGVEHGRPGRYTVTALPGSAPIGQVAASRPRDDDPIRARVTGSGGRRVLRYDVGDAEGRRVTFLERGGATLRRLGTAHGRRGALRFAPAPGAAGARQVLAQVTVDGVPGPELVVARFRAGPPPRPGRPARLRVRRRGTTIVASWRAAANAQRYGVVLDRRTGAQRVRELRASRRSIAFPGIARWQRGSVRVTALGRFGDAGRPRSGRFRGTGHAPTRLRPFSKLGRR